MIIWISCYLYIRTVHSKNAKISFSIIDKLSTVVKMRNTTIPSLAIKPPATLKDVVEFLRKASKEYDPSKEGVNFVLKMAEEASAPAVPRLRANNISIYHAVELAARVTGYDFEVKDDCVVIFKKGGAAKK